MLNHIEPLLGKTLQDLRKAKNISQEQLAELQQLKQEEKLCDYVLCGSVCEGHKLQKEVNFSDTLLVDGKQCRIPGNKASLRWSRINAHGWFSYEIKVKPEKENTISFLLGSATDFLSIQIIIGNKTHVIKENISGLKEYTFPYLADETGKVRIRIGKSYKIMESKRSIL